MKLVGTESNRDGMGARVALLRENRPVIWRHAHTDGSYLSASDIRVHFGLGGDTLIDGIGVIWPGGTKERWKNIQTNRHILLTEGSGEAWTEYRTKKE